MRQRLRDGGSSGREIEMPFTVMLSPDARKYLDSLDKKRAENVRKHLKELEEDPFKP